VISFERVLESVAVQVEPDPRVAGFRGSLAEEVPGAWSTQVSRAFNERRDLTEGAQLMTLKIADSF
jgi:hypothetical protein